MDTCGRDRPLRPELESRGQIPFPRRRAWQALRLARLSSLMQPKSLQNSGGSLCRAKKLILRTYLTPEEHAQIRASASKAGLSLSTFSKRVCLGFSVPSLEHQEARIELRRLKGDLGRLGGLVKQALANGADRLTVHRLLHELDVRQREVQQAIAGIR